MGGYDLSKMESHSAVSLSVGRSVGRSVGQLVSQSVRKKEKSVFPVTGKVVISIYANRGKKEGSRRLYKYRKMPRH